MPEYRLVPATETLVEKFVENLAIGAIHFRYFQKRPFSIIKSHLLTLISVNEAGKPVAYGHLDKENRRLWLGIAVADDYQNLGLGTDMMKALIAFAVKKQEPAICLSVDKTNEKAKKLYQKMGFLQIAEHSNHLIFQLPLL